MKERKKCTARVLLITYIHIAVTSQGVISVSSAVREETGLKAGLPGLSLRVSLPLELRALFFYLHLDRVRCTEYSPAAEISKCQVRPVLSVQFI